MLSGFYVLKGGGGTRYTPAFPRGGGSAVFSFELLDTIGSPTQLSFVVEHKNAEDVAWGSAGSLAVNQLGVFSVDVSPVKEEVRISLSVSATNGWEGYYMLIAPPSWRDF